MDLAGQRFVVIGGAGLIGSHTVDLLLEYDVAQINVFDDFSRGTHENLTSALRDPRVKIFEAGGNICHRDILGAALTNADGVFHFAALWLLQCADFPRAAFDVNVAGFFNVLEACVEKHVRRLVFSSSASVYGDAVEEPMTEDHPHNNQNFYGATKIADEALARAMHYRFNLAYVGLRYMNVYGPRQDYRGAYVAVIMRMLDAIANCHPLHIHGDGTQSYDFVYVKDCARANILAMKATATDRFYNVGTGIKTSLNSLANTLLRLTESTLGIIHDESRTSFVNNRVGSTGRAHEEIGFEAQTGLEEGLRSLIAWHAADRSVHPQRKLTASGAF